MRLQTKERGLRPLKTLAIVSKMFIVAYLLSGLLCFVVGSFLFYMEVKFGFTYPFQFVTSIASLIAFAVVAISAFPIGTWLYVARANLAQAGLPGLVFSPGWTVASFFVPVANLFVPFRSMRELYNRSHDEDMYQALATVPDVSAWWACLVAGTMIFVYFVGVVLLAKFTGTFVVAPPGVNTLLALLAQLLLCGSAIYLFRIIGAITSAQRTYVNLAAAFA